MTLTQLKTVVCVGCPRKTATPLIPSLTRRLADSRQLRHMNIVHLLSTLRRRPEDWGLSSTADLAGLPRSKPTASWSVSCPSQEQNACPHHNVTDESFVNVTIHTGCILCSFSFKIHTICFIFFGGGREYSFKNRIF